MTPTAPIGGGFRQRRSCGGDGGHVAMARSKQ